MDNLERRDVESPAPLHYTIPYAQRTKWSKRTPEQGIAHGEPFWLPRGPLYTPRRTLQELAISSRIVGRDLVILHFGKCDFSFLRSL